MKRVLSVLTIILILVVCMPLSVAASTSQNVKLPSDEEIPGIVDSYVKQNRGAAASVSIHVFHGKEDIYSVLDGYIDFENQIRPDENTVYEWGSTTKLLTWVSVMQLVEQGKLDLDADIRTYLPDGFLSKLKSNTPITLMHVMNHTAGWQETTWDVETTDPDRIVSLEQALRQSEPPQIYAPGEQCAYSNWGCALAGYIVERVSGQPFHAYVKAHIFVPLGMKKTALAPDLSDNQWVRTQRDKYYIDGKTHENLRQSIRYILLYPSGMATGTPEDLVLFAKALVPGDEPSPLFKNPNTLSQLLAPSLYYGESDIPRVSHGLWHTPYGVDTVGHAGNTVGSTANLVMDPESGRGVVIMTNQPGETNFCYGLLPKLFGVRSSADAGEPSAAEVAGIYRSTRTLHTGVLKIVGAIGGGFFPFIETDDPYFFKLAVGEGGLKQIAPNEYMLNIGGLETYAYLYEDAAGGQQLQMMSQDNIKSSPLSFWFDVAIALLAVIASLYAIVMLLITLIARIAGKLRKVPTAFVPFRKMYIVTLLATLGMGIILFLIFTSGSVTPETVYWKSILATILAFVPVLFGICYLLKKSARDSLSTGKKVGYVVLIVAGIVLTFNILYWQIFYFWF